MTKIEYDELYHLFSCPLLKINVPDHHRLNKLLKSESRAWKKHAKGVNVSNKGDSWHSPDGLLSRKEPGFKEFSKLVPQIAALYVQKINPFLDLRKFSFEANAWVNINKKGGFNTVHTHGKFHISGCYYVKQPKIKSGQSGMIEFVNSRFDHHIHSMIGGDVFGSKFAIRPDEGDMIVFPSTLLHSVYPNETEEERISIAWNVVFKEKSVSMQKPMKISSSPQKGATLKFESLNFKDA